MSTAALHHQVPSATPPQSAPSSSPQFDLGGQILYIIKFVIYALVLIKIFQLTFLKYRRKLAISDRVQRKYKYCHNELINNYTEDETKLMHTTINNTIKNTEIKSSKKLKKSKTLTKRVSFDTQRNNYYPLKAKSFDDYGEVSIENSAFKKEDPQAIEKKEQQEAQRHVETEMPPIKEESVQQSPQDPPVADEPAVPSEMPVPLPEEGSKITEETQDSKLRQGSCMQSFVTPKDHGHGQDCQKSPLNA